MSPHRQIRITGITLMSAHAHRLLTVGRPQAHLQRRRAVSAGIDCLRCLFRRRVGNGFVACMRHDWAFPYSAQAVRFQGILTT